MPSHPHRSSPNYRPVRAHPRPLPDVELVVAPPPPTPGGATGTLPYLLPVASSIGSVGLLLATPGRKSPLLLGVVVGVMALSLGLALLLHARQWRARRRERARYLAHLDDLRRRLGDVAAAQREAAEWLYPDLGQIWSLVVRRERLWERRPGDDDFLAVRVGRGTVPLKCRLRVELDSDPLADHDAALLAAARRLADDATALPDLPLVVPLRRYGVVAVTGAPDRARALLRPLLAQLAAFHAPDELRLLVGFPPSARAAWDWVKWLPHVREPASPAGAAAGLPPCRLAETPEQLADLLDQELPPRRAKRVRRAGRAAQGEPAVALPAGTAPPPQPGATQAPTEPWLLVVLDGFSVRGALARLPAVQELLGCAPGGGVTVLCLTETRAAEPSELALRIELDGDELSVQETAASGRCWRGRPDQSGPALCEAIARSLAPLRLERGGAAGFPDRVRLLDLLGIDRVDPERSWRPRPREALLRVPIGQRPDGEAVVLDLKEAADGGMGPHGLIIGATGSGKSELLRSTVAALAITHPPEVLSFVLIDFKGGAAFAELAALPHTAGVITNLQDDLGAVDRMRAALQGEIERRQRLLRQAGNLEGIARYHAAARQDASVPPMPYLLVIVDEFGELLASRPEFLDLFVAAGRLGRSLGIHLLLASQRLDEGHLRGLESHLRYRICLRTFSAAESLAVLGTDDAYLLPPTPGLGWLKVDSEVYLCFKAALVSTEQPEPRPAAGAMPAVRPFAPVGSRWPSASVPGGADGGGAAVTDLRAVVVALAAAGRPTHQVWLPPLPAALPLDRVLALAGRTTGSGAMVMPASGPEDPGWLRVPVGIVDMPRAQAQEVLLLDLSGAAGHLAVVGAPRSGKSVLLATVAAALALTHTPDAVQLYGIDLGGGLLRGLAPLPSVGAVCGRHEHDRLRALARQLRALVAEREQRFRLDGIDSMAAWHRHRRQRQPATTRGGGDDRSYGEVILLVDNWGLLHQELEDVEAELVALAATGLHYGVHLIVSANRWHDLRPALRDSIGGRLELRLNDPLESEFGRHAAAALPPGLPGRGLVASGQNEALQFQAALPRVDGVAHPGDLAAALEHLVRQVPPDPGGAAAPPLRLLPALVSLSDLASAAAGGEGGSAAQPPGVAFALDEQRLAPVWLDLLAAPHFLVFGDAGCGKTSLLRCLAGQLQARYRPDELRLAVVDVRRTLLDLADAASAHLAGYACTGPAAAELSARLRELLVPRLPVAAPSAPGSPGPPGPRQWSGPHLVLLVDDYELLLGPGGSPLAPLLDLIGHGRDLGLHVVCARAVGGTARTSFEPVFQRLREAGGPGLIMSGDPQEGPLLGGYRAAPLPPGRGLLVQRHGTGSRLVQVAFAPAPAAPAAVPRRR